MPKKRKKSASAPRKKQMTAAQREELLVENFVGIQKAMTNLSIKFENLSDNMSSLLEVFELAAKEYTQKTGTTDTQLLKKIDSLLDQNKTIAKGLVLIEEKIRTRTDNRPPQENPPQSFRQQRPLPGI